MRSRHSKMQIGGGKCSICRSPGANKTTCPGNPKVTNPNYEKHMLWQPEAGRSSQKTSKKKTSKPRSSPNTNQPCLSGEQLKQFTKVRGNVFHDGDRVYRIVGLENVDDHFMKKLGKAQLTPTLYEVRYCTFPTKNDKRKLLMMEKYTGTLYDLLSSENRSEDEIISNLEKVFQISTDLNGTFNIRHGDFHGDNIVYKMLPNGEFKWALIDFELATEYSPEGKVLRTGLPNKEDPSLYYNPLYDIMSFEAFFYDPQYAVKFIGPHAQMARDHFMSSQGEGELEMIEDTIADNKDKITLIFHISPEGQVRYEGKSQ